VAGAPELTAGETYLIFADLAPNGRWQPRLLAASVLRRDFDRQGAEIFVPVEESHHLNLIGEAAYNADLLRIPVYAALFTERLRDVLGGRTEWVSEGLEVPSDMLPETTAQFQKYDRTGCVYLEDGGHPIRWRKFDR